MKRLVLGILVGAGLAGYAVWHFSQGGTKDPVAEIKRALNAGATNAVGAIEGRIEEGFEDARAAVETEFSDAKIAATIKTRFIREQELDGFKLKVDVKNGAVILRGTVESTEQLSRAVRIAGAVDGVTGVDAEISVAAN